MAVERRKDNKRRVLKEGEYQRANGTFEYRWRDRLGERHSIYAKTLDELRVKKEGVLKDVLNGIEVANQDITVDYLFNLLMQTKVGLKDSSRQKYRCLYQLSINPYLGKAKVGNLKKTDIKSFYNKLANDHGYQMNTISGIHTILRQILDIGVDDNYLRDNPCDGAMKDLKKNSTLPLPKKP